jgi:hypothetical protein
VTTNTTIHRYDLYVTDTQVINVPVSHTILSVAPGRQQHHGVHSIDMWIKVRPSPNADVGIWILGTGNPWPTFETNGGTTFTYDLDFIGTCVMENQLVWHVFEGPIPHDP